MHSPKYSLLLPVRNEVTRIEAVVHAIFKDLADNLGWEICFGDDFSDDGTFEKLKKLSDQFPLKLIRPKANLGRGGIRNLLAKEAVASILVFLDGDCQVQPGFFKAWENLDPDCAYIGRVNYDNNPKSGFSRFLSQGSGIGKLRTKTHIPAAYFISQNFRLSKAIFEKIQGFRTDLLGWGGEDTDLGYKLKKLGTPLVYNGKAMVLHPSVVGLELYFSRLVLFGKINLPVLVQENPELAVQFKLGYARRPWALLFCNPIILLLCKALILSFKGWPWPYVFYRYVIFNSYARGYQQAPITAPQ
jgi:glycosyltransferase involved in cell wall biosynthesis